jgi:hypothetical protein
MIEQLGKAPMAAEQDRKGSYFDRKDPSSKN